MEGWWIAFGFSGLSLSIGALVCLLWRDKERRKCREKEALQRLLREAGLEKSPRSVRDLEEIFRKKG
jgi:hypothetical protein